MNASEAEKKVRERCQKAVPWRSRGRWRIYDGPMSMFEMRQPLSEWCGSKSAAWLDAAQRMEANHGA